MGAWGGGIYENDEANDWAGGVMDADDVGRVRATLLETAEWPSDHELDDVLGEQALAAADMVAIAAGKPGPRTEPMEDVFAWVFKHPELADLRAVALAAVEQVLRPNSLLHELWLEDSDPELDDSDLGLEGPVRSEWLDPVNDLRSRLEGG